ncbi:zinc finger ZAT9-like, partial [Olea europaea subsp. europaea]
TVAPSYVPANKPLRVKIKFPNVKKSVEEEDMEDGPKVKYYFCLECKKRFSSGKALGGHMSSAHVQGNKDFSLKKLKSKKKISGANLGAIQSDADTKQNNTWILTDLPLGIVPIDCKYVYKVICNKEVLIQAHEEPSDREWRGMEPPDETATNFSGPEFGAMNEVPLHVLDGDQVDSGLVMASAVVGLNESMKWQVRGKRGGSPTKPVIDSPPRPNSKPSEDLDSKVKEGESISSNYCTPEDETNDANQDFHLNKDREKVFPVGDERYSHVKKLKVWERTDENPGGTQSRRIICNCKGKGKLIPGYDTENSTSSDSSSDEFNYPYIYRTVFQHLQALGGHRSSHKKFKVKVYNTIDDHSSIGASYKKIVSKANAIKQLEALGDQNQCHCTGECNHADHVTSIDKAKKERRVHEFDLNVKLSEDGEKGMEPDNTAS